MEIRFRRHDMFVVVDDNKNKKVPQERYILLYAYK